jgi:hypothetical protein
MNFPFEYPAEGRFQAAVALSSIQEFPLYG